jgi:citrate lyase subunit beta / citryl-CoA lyase
MPPPTRRRSCLSVPGASEKMLRTALDLPADEIVLDLEDAVAPARKPEARAIVAAALSDGAWRRRTISVRINAPGTPWCHEDVLAVAATGHPALTLVVPKVEDIGDLAFMDRLLAGAEAAAPRQATIGLQALIETARGLVNLQAIAGASGRLRALILGYADLASSLGRPAGSEASWRSAQDAIVLAAHANGLEAIDGPCLDLTGNDALRRDSELARQLGFDGKWAIHPSQLETINGIFTPPPEEVEQARALLAHLDQALADGVGASAFAGGMVDEAMRPAALRTLARADVKS